MRILALIIRGYVILMFIWAIGTWIPGFAGSAFHNLLGLPVIPVANMFSFLSIGNVGLGLMVVAFGLSYLAGWIEKTYVHDDFEDSADIPDPSPQDSRRSGGDF